MKDNVGRALRSMVGILQPADAALSEYHKGITQKLQEAYASLE